jgi:diguanylate cyclase (GGDEF)-like protein
VASVDGQPALRVTASVGAASMPVSAADARDLIAAADAALYEAKRSGKNRVATAPARSPAGKP